MKNKKPEVEDLPALYTSELVRHLNQLSENIGSRTLPSQKFVDARSIGRFEKIKDANLELKHLIRSLASEEGKPLEVDGFSKQLEAIVWELSVLIRDAFLLGVGIGQFSPELKYEQAFIAQTANSTNAHERTELLKSAILAECAGVPLVGSSKFANSIREAIRQRMGLVPLPKQPSLGLTLSRMKTWPSNKTIANVITGILQERAKS